MLEIFEFALTKVRVVDFDSTTYEKFRIYRDDFSNQTSTEEYSKTEYRCSFSDFVLILSPAGLDRTWDVTFAK